MNLGPSPQAWSRVHHFDTFRKTLNVFSKWMVKREELTMFVERRILATLLQPCEPHNFLTYWAWELPLTQKVHFNPYARKSCRV